MQRFCFCVWRAGSGADWGWYSWPWELLRQSPLGGLNCAISAVPTVGASSCPGFPWRRPNTAAPAASTFLGSSTAGGKRGTKQPTHFSRYKKEEVQMSFEAEVIPLFIRRCDRGQRDRVFPGLAESAASEGSPGAVCRARGCHAAGIFLLDSQSVCQLAGALSGYCLHFQLCEYRPFRPLLGCQRPLRGSDALPLGCTKTLIIPVCGSGYPVNTCVSCHNARPVRSSCAVFGGSAALQTRRTACG